MNNNKTAKLILSNGMVFEGKSIGAENTLFGELVFNTSMTGYQEVLTDPSYASQVVVMTYPEIGNTGINQYDFESDSVYARGFIVKNYCENESHYQSMQTLSEFLKENNVVGISGVDTRHLTRILRESGTMNCMITTDNVTDKLIDELERYELSKDLVTICSRKKTESFYCKKSVENPINIAVVDLGIKNSILKTLKNFDCNITIFPCDVDADTLLDSKFDAVFLSNGPGDPQDCTSIIKMVGNLVGNIPIFGICLGYQILSIVLGAKTYKLKYGHRGGNHPVINLESNKVIITSQNHGYAVDMENLGKNMKATHKNLNDGTLEGFSAEKLRIYAVQFHPEAAPGPCDAVNICADWIEKIRNYKKNSNNAPKNSKREIFA